MRRLRASFGLVCNNFPLLVYPVYYIYVFGHSYRNDRTRNLEYRFACHRLFDVEFVCTSNYKDIDMVMNSVGCILVSGRGVAVISVRGAWYRVGTHIQY